MTPKIQDREITRRWYQRPKTQEPKCGNRHPRPRNYIVHGTRDPRLKMQKVIPGTLKIGETQTRNKHSRTVVQMNLIKCSRNRM